MKIRTRLSLYFTLISSGALLLVLVAVYVSVSASFRRDFNKRLADRLQLGAQMYLEADELRADSLTKIQQKYLEKLPDEVIRIYNEKNKASFTVSTGIYWSANIINQVRAEGSIEYMEGQRQVIGRLYKDNQGDFVILASAIDRSFERRLKIIAQTGAVLFLCFSIILFFAGQWFAKKALSPVQNVIDQMQQMRSNNLHLRVAESKNKDEIAELITNFNNLLERLENAFELQQNFVANASHELRTPLTSIMGEADVALEKTRTEKEYQRVLQSVSADAMRLQEIISGLMELAQVNTSYTLTEFAPVRVDELMWDLHEQWTAQKGEGKLKLTFGTFPEDENALIIMANKALLSIALNNIIDNAFKYSNDDVVELYFDAWEEVIKISITDKGPGIPTEEAAHIFKSFYRTGATAHIPGTGIGLYITGKIIQLFHGSVEVVSDGSVGSCFIINLPKKMV